MSGEQGWGFSGKSLTWNAGDLLSTSVQFHDRSYASSCAPSPFGEDASKSHSPGLWLTLTPTPATHTHLSIASSELGLPGAGGLLASLPGVSRSRAWSPELASFPASASAKLFLASRGAGRTAGSAARVNFCGSRMSKTEKEILWWEGAALAPPSCQASMPAAREPEAGGAGPGMATLGLPSSVARRWLFSG